MRKPMLFAALLMTLPLSAFAIGKGKAVYVGGTVAGIEDKTEGPIDLKDEVKLVFMPNKGSKLELPWSSIEEAEYGQKAGRRVVMAVVISPVALFSKNRKHYVTLSWKDAEAKGQ